MRAWLIETITNPSTFWTAAGALATWCAVLGIFLAARQLRFSAWLRAQEIFTSEAFVKARRTVFVHLATPTQQWPDTDREAALFVCRSMDDLCHLAPYLGRSRVIEWWGNPLAKSWAAVAWLVFQERDATQHPSKWHAYQRLAEESLRGLPPALRAQLEKARDTSVAALRSAEPPAAPGAARPTSGCS